MTKEDRSLLETIYLEVQRINEGLGIVDNRLAQIEVELENTQKWFWERAIEIAAETTRKNAA